MRRLNSILDDLEKAFSHFFMGLEAAMLEEDLKRADKLEKLIKEAKKELQNYG